MGIGRPEWHKSQVSGWLAFTSWNKYEQVSTRWYKYVFFSVVLIVLEVTMVEKSTYAGRL